MTKGYAGPPDPERGVPFRHARAKAHLMLSHASGEQMLYALNRLIESRPNEVLDVLIDVMGEG